MSGSTPYHVTYSLPPTAQSAAASGKKASMPAVEVATLMTSSRGNVATRSWLRPGSTPPNGTASPAAPPAANECTTLDAPNAVEPAPALLIFSTNCWVPFAAILTTTQV